MQADEGIEAAEQVNVIVGSPEVGRMGRVDADSMLQTLLDTACVAYHPLTESERVSAEREWRAVYGSAFRGRPRLRHGARAGYEYARQPAGRWLVVPLSSRIVGTPVEPLSRRSTAYEWEGPLVPLGAAHNLEFAVVPLDLSWDHALHARRSRTRRPVLHPTGVAT
jgi:hypothetical protein